MGSTFCILEALLTARTDGCNQPRIFVKVFAHFLYSQFSKVGFSDWSNIRVEWTTLEPVCLKWSPPSSPSFPPLLICASTLGPDQAQQMPHFEIYHAYASTLRKLTSNIAFMMQKPALFRQVQFSPCLLALIVLTLLQSDELVQRLEEPLQRIFNYATLTNVLHITHPPPLPQKILTGVCNIVG